MEDQAKKIVKFEKYDNFEEIGSRADFVNKDGDKQQVLSGFVHPSHAKPTGMYELTSDKDKYLKSSFWAIENTPSLQAKKQKEETVVKCPGSDHKLTLKKLRNVIVKDIDTHFICAICSKEIGRQKVGSYRCGHLICHGCKSDKCEMCGKEGGWIDIQSSSSAFASHNKAEVKTYTHAFYM